MSFAQTQWGVTANMNMSNVPVSSVQDVYEYLGANLGLDFNVPETRLGIRLGISASKELSDAMALNTGIIYSTKGYSGSVGEHDFDEALNYIEVPVNLAFSVSDKFSLMGGFYSAVLIGHKLRNNQVTNSAGVPYSWDIDRRPLPKIEVGIGLGVQFFITDAISFNSGYQRGINFNLPNIKEIFQPVDLKTSNLFIGMTYNFGGG